MKKSMMRAGALIPVLFLWLASGAQDTRSTSSSALLYEVVRKGAVVEEDHDKLIRTIPSAKAIGLIRANNSAKPTGLLLPAVQKAQDEQQVFVENRNLLNKAVVATATSNPSASADYCTTPTVMQGCCNYWIKDNIANKNVLYGPPDEVFANETGARNYYLSLKPRMPFYLPYSDSKVKPGNVWYYSNGNGHGSIDYSKESSAYGPGIDPTFKVLAAGSGKVVSKGWVDLFGNFLIIEHKAPNGTVYRTGYFHLRDGFDHDLQKAKATKVTSGDPKSRDSLYKLFANKSNPSQLLWGTNSQKIKVNVGDNVHAGQHIAYAGNTGYGGAGWGLNDSGDPKNPYTANNHLHYMHWIKSPATSGDQSWLELDPYGVYALVNDNNRDCLQAGVNNGFKRFFAPHYPSFHNVPLEYVVGEFGYFPGTGMGLQTLNVHRKGSDYYAAGSFQYGLPTAWYCRINMNGTQYQNYFNEYAAKGFIPRQISVTKSNGGDPLFTVIWRKLEPGEKTAAYHNIDDAAWNNAWKKHVDQEKKSVTEHLRYEVNGKVYHAGVFSSINKGFYVYYGMDAASFQNKFDELFGKKYMPISIRAEEIGGKTTFAGVWVPLKGSVMAHSNLSMAGYQDKFDEYVSKGYRLTRVMSYANGTKFAAIWNK